jgi:hypothetical protein
VIEFVEIIAVITVQTVLCSNPDKSGLILADGMEPVVGQLSDGITVDSLCHDR